MPCRTGRAQQRLRERIAYQTGANDVLKVMSASPGDPQPVFDLIVERSRDLCDGYGATVYQFDGTLIHWRAATGVSDDPSARQVSKRCTQWSRRASGLRAGRSSTDRSSTSTILKRNLGSPPPSGA